MVNPTSGEIALKSDSRTLINFIFLVCAYLTTYKTYTMPTPPTLAQLAQHVLLIRITMHTTGKFFEADTRSGNHASIFLITSDQTSIRLNMTKAGPTDTMGTYTISFCAYTHSNTSVANIDITPVQGLTAGHVTQLITQNRRERYQLARRGVGCRFWV